MNRRDLFKQLGAAAGLGAAPEPLRARLPFRQDIGGLKDYGLLACPNARLLEIFRKSCAGILACTLNDQTHCADTGQLWGPVSWLNDLYFGLQGGVLIGGGDQHRIFCKELRKIAQHVGIAPGRPPVPYTVSADGREAKFNPDPGFDLDRCAEFILETVRMYEMTGDRRLAQDLYPKCVEVAGFLARRDLDGDLLIEGRTEFFTDLPNKGVGACASVSYIGDTAANTWKDFGASLFYYDALEKLALLESILGKNDEAERRHRHARQVRDAARKILWSNQTDGFLAWVEKNGTAHSDWITGNNLHAIACGLADPEQSGRILKKLDQHQQEIEGVVPCRVRIGVYEKGMCSNRPDYYWNGGIWPLVSAADMRARATMGDVSGALRVAELLSTRPQVTDMGFFEAYDGRTGAPGTCAGLLMNNGGFLWGFLEGVLGVEIRGDDLRFRASLPKRLLPARARIRYRSSDLEVHWLAGRRSSGAFDREPVRVSGDGYYELHLGTELKPTYRMEIVQSEG